MSLQIDLEAYLTNGVEALVADLIKSVVSNPAESIYMARYALASKKASARREDSSQNWEAHPTFFDCQHHQLLQFALRRMLCPGQS